MKEIFPQIILYIGTWSEKTLQNVKKLPSEVLVDLNDLLSREDSIVNSIIQEAVENSLEEAIARISKLAQVFRAKRELPQSITKGTIFSQPGEKGGYTSTLYNVVEDTNLIFKQGGGRLPNEAKAMIELETLDILTVYIKRVQLANGEYGLLLEKIEDAVGSKSIIGRTRKPLSPPEYTEFVTQKTIDDLEDIYQKLKNAGANVGDFQFIIRKSDGTVFLNDPTSFGFRKQGPQGDVQNIVERFKKILKNKNKEEK